jgi:hypothetical protein
VLFHINCPECGSNIVKTGAPRAADANSEFDKAIADIKLLGATPETEPSSSRQMVEQCAAVEARRLRPAQSPAPTASGMCS